MSEKKVNIIGGGFAGLAAAAILAKEGYQVRLFEKNSQLGGRCRSFEAEGFNFDMGPSWYWMPDVFERFYQLFGYTTSDFYELKRLDPSYQIIYDDGDIVKMPANYEELKAVFESYEQGSAQALDEFLSDAEYKYQVGMTEFVHKPSLSVWEFANLKTLRRGLKLNLFGSIAKMIRRKFKNEKLIQMLEFPVLFLGAKPQETPALYSLMNYADIKLGTWYPMGGMAEISKALEKIVLDLGVDIHLNEEVLKINTENGIATSISTTIAEYPCDYCIGGGDYHHIESKLLEPKDRSYSDTYWNSRTMAPSSLLYYIGIDRKIEGLLHHNLFFDTNFDVHARSIYDEPSWPEEPLFYVCCPSKTDPSVAPEGKENLFLLIPIAAGLKDNTNEHERLFNQVADRIGEHIKFDIRQHIIYQRAYCLEDFKQDYHSFKGNAYGLANTLMQTAFLKPRLRSKKVKNMFYAGQLTTPGPGMPPSLISGEVAANFIINMERE